jgi:isoleucyl-tRNA synthetase
MSEGSKKSETAQREEEVLAFWNEQKIFEKSLKKPAPKGQFVFYEGPPTANGKPGIHHLESRAFKDAIPRYKTMCGYRVHRKAGWDTHGLPVELEVEKQLGFSGKPDIEKFGIAAFNEKCRESVLAYVDEWWRFTERVAYWVDQNDAYYTFAPDYMERLWGILAHVNKNGQLYKDYKVVPWCPRCGTALSSHEVAQGYEEVTDLSVTAKFRVLNIDRIGEKQPTFILAWTTTPWTLPGNVALAVGPNIEYVKIRHEGETLIVARERAEANGLSTKGAESIMGKQLVGIEYEPLYRFVESVASDDERERFKQAFRIRAADFVTTEDGTGVVHTAVMYGADDFELGIKEHLPRVHVVEPTGVFTKGLGFLEGRFVRDETVAIDIIKDLAHRALLFSKEKYSHSYPFCWRCKTALIYYARDSWYIRMSSLKDVLIQANRTVNWVPNYLKEGRMGEWLRGVKDWAISRERYWATPLPVWETKDGSERKVIGSVAELKQSVKKSGNTYFLMRHGQAESNAKNVASTTATAKNHLTELGKAQARKSGISLKNKNIDLIITTPILRARETAELVAEAIHYPKENIITDERIREIDVGIFEGRSVKEFHEFFGYSYATMFTQAPEGGETLADMKRRIGDFLYDLEEKHHGKNILIVAHEYSIWMAEAVALGANVQQTIALKEPRPEYYETGEVRQFDFVPLPHNREYEIDLHRPFIDDVVLLAPSGKEMYRVPDVVDVWFDSGAMPFGTRSPYPADYIAEAIDQTRGWFYTLLAVGVLMGKGAAYKNVISLGHLLDAEGKKMSKSRGNTINPWDALNEWGADTLRFWMYSVNDAGDTKNFAEKTVREASRVMSWLENSAKFYELFKDETFRTTTPQVIDQWMSERTQQAVDVATQSLDRYDLTSASRAIADLFEDLSQWYVRRIRDRVRDGDQAALLQLRETLHISARLLAPFAPFLAERVYHMVKEEKEPESVHLTAWPEHRSHYFMWNPFKRSRGKGELMDDMREVRELVSLALEARQKAGIKVRQPLQKLTVNSTQLLGKHDLLALIKDELNVKEVVVQTGSDEKIVLDTTITPELEEEGSVRELMREIQDLRKKAELSPKDQALLVYAGDTALIEKHWNIIKEAANLTGLEKGESTHVKKA